MSALATIREATAQDDVALARALFVEYAHWLGVDLCFQGFDEELATLPGAYARPRGRLLLAGSPGTAFGCIALRPLDAVDGGAVASVGEVKRLYVQPSARNAGWGRRLAERLVVDARAIGYAELKLDTLEWMESARALYGALGFRACPPYYDNPLPGVVYMSLSLGAMDRITPAR
jgi:GNAT superfamily N-acetyltransferase